MKGQVQRIAPAAAFGPPAAFRDRQEPGFGSDEE